MIAGDKGEANLGLDQQTWQRLADTVDLIVDPAALVNHVLPYSELFGPNALGTAELIRDRAHHEDQAVRLRVDDRRRRPVSSRRKFVEDADIRVISATRKVDDSYANGYGNSKWAGEVLLREAHDLCGLPVAVFRCDMILADTTYAGQLNLPDMFTRMMLSLVATGIAPGSFYELDADGNRQRAHYDGLPVEFIAEAISTLGAHVPRRVRDLPRDEPVRRRHRPRRVRRLARSTRATRSERIGDYGDWLQRFETAMRALPERQRQASLLPLLHNYQRPEKPIRGSIAPTDRFRAAVQDAKIGPDKDIPHVTARCHRQVRRRSGAARSVVDAPSRNRPLQRDGHSQEHDGDQREDSLCDGGPRLVRRGQQQHERCRQHRPDTGEDEREPDPVVADAADHDPRERDDGQKQVVEALVEGQLLGGQRLFFGDAEGRPGSRRRPRQRLHHPDVDVQESRKASKE